MADQTVTLRITANADGVITGVAVAKKELSGIGDAAEYSGKRAEAGMASARRGVISISEQLKNAKQQLVGFFAGFATVQGIRQLAEIADKASNIRAQLQLATNGSAEFARAQSEVYAISQRTSTAMASTAELYARLARSTAEYNVSQQRNLALTETINKTFVVSGTAAQAQANAVTQLTQAFAGGVLRAEEFNSIIENSPRLAQALADGMGIGIGKLRQYVNDGKVSVAEMITALESQSAKIDEEFSRMPLTIERAWTQIGNAVLKYVGDADQATGASRDIAEALSWVADNIAEIIDAAWALGKALAALYTARLLSQAALYTNELAKQAVLHLAAASAAQEMGIKTQAGVAASLKSIGLVNAALGALGAAVAGWQIGTYLREQFIEVELFGIAMVNGLLKAWNHLKAGVALAWEGIKSAAMLAMDAVTEAMARLLRIAASAGNVEVFGKKLFGGTAQEASKLAATLSDLVDPVGDFIAAQSRIAEETRQANAEVDRITGELADYAIENRTAAEAATGAADAGGAMKDALNGVPPAADAAAGSVENLYTHLAQVTDVTGDVDAMIRSMARTLADDAVRAQMDYQDNLSAILDLEMQWMALGPLSEEQIAKLNSARAMAGELYRRDMEALNADTVREAERAAEKSTRAWDRFAGSLADAVLDGSQGVKRWWKAMLDNMKAQLIKSGLLRLFGSLFNTGGSGGFSLAGGGAGIGFGSILQLAGSLGGGTGGSLLTGLAGAISSGISGGLMNLGGTLAGLGMGSLGGGLAWAGGSIAANGLLGGLGKSFMTGLGNLFGGGSALMGIGQMIPAIAAIGAVAAAIQKISGGKLFGTKYKFESAQQQFDFTGAGFDGSASMTEVRQRSLFRGRKWRTTALDIDAETKASMEEFWNAILDANSEIARQFGRDAAIDVPASFKQEMDASGKVTAEIGTILGRQYRETWETFAKRISAENIIANIDGILGTTVPAPIFGGGGGGGGPPGRRGDSTIVAGVGNAVIMDVQQQIGEASAIAERWRSSAEELLEGAQYLLLAATDMHNGANLLGDGTLTQITDLIEDLQASGETLSDTYLRVAGATALLDQALALSGVGLDKTREEVVRFAAGIADAAGGLDRAAALWSDYFDRYYSDSERAAFALTQAQAQASREFGDIGLDYNDFTGEGGLAEFRRLFEEALPNLSAEAVVEWLEAAAALGIVIDATDALNASLGAAAVTAEQLAERAAILADIDSAIEDFGLSEWEKQLKAIDTQQQTYIRSLMDTGMTLDEATAAAQRWGAAARENAETQRQAQLDDLLGGIAFDAALAGMTQLDAELARIAQTFDGYIAQAVALGASEEQLAQIRAAGADAARRAQEAAQAAILQPLIDDIDRMRIALSETGMSDYARQQAAIARETQQAITAALAAGATAADVLRISMTGAERAMLAAAMAASDFRSQIAGWEFDEYVAGLSDAEAAVARANHEWERRYQQAIEIFGEGSEEAIRVLGLWDRAISGMSQSVTQSAQAVQAASLTMGDIFAAVKSWADQLNESLAHLKGGDAMANWLSDLSGLPTLAAQKVRRPLAEVVGMVRDEYLRQAADLQQQIARAYAKLEALPWNAQAESEELTRRIAAMQQALASIGGSMGTALDELQRMYIASMQGVRDYLDSMLLDDMSVLSAEEKLAEAWDQLNAAVQAGDGDAATRLADVYLRLLRDFEASGDDYNTGWQSVRSLLEGMLDFDIGDLLDGAGGLDAGAQIASQQLDAVQVTNDWLAQIAANTANGPPGGWPGSWPGGIPPYAAGGWVNGPTALLAGEAGRELILPNPVSEFFQRAGIPVNVSGGGSAGVEARLDAVIERLDRLERTTAQGAQQVSATVAKTGETSDRSNDASRQRLMAGQRRGVLA